MNGSRNPSPPEKRMLVVLLAAVCTLVVGVHVPVLSANALSFDDNMYLTENPLVQSPGWSSCRRFLLEATRPSTVRGYYQPLTMISLMTDCALGGRPDDLQQFHLTSLILHGINTALVVVLLHLWFGSPWIAAGVGLLFGLHPMTVEPIAWLSERKTLLAGFFAFLCLILHTRHARQNGRGLYLGCLLAYVLALLSKPTSLLLPFVMALLDYWPLGRCTKKAALEKLPFLAIGGGAAVIMFLSQRSTGGLVLPDASDLGQMLLVFCRSTSLYLSTMVWPAHLPHYHPLPEFLTLSDPGTMVGVVGSGILIFASLVSLHWTRCVATSGLIFFVALLPALNFLRFTNVIVSDKYAYLPSIGLLMLLAACAAGLSRFAGRNAGTPQRILTVAGAGLCAVLASAEAVATRQCLSAWRDTIGLHEHLLETTPDAVELHSFLGTALLARGQSDQAMHHFRRAVQIDPTYAPGYHNLGVALQSRGRQREAARYFQRAFQFWPANPMHHNNFGEVLLATGNYRAAIRHFRLALQADPSRVQTHHGLGVALALAGRFSEGITCLRYAFQLNPDYIPVLRDLACILASHPDVRAHGAAEAISLAGRAADLTDHQDPGVLYVLSMAYAADGRFGQATAEAQRALAVASQGTVGQEQMAALILACLECYARREPVRQLSVERGWSLCMRNQGTP